MTSGFRRGLKSRWDDGRCAVSTYVLIAIIKKQLHLSASLYTCLQILSVPIFEKTQISCALQTDTTRTVSPPIDNQLNLFDF